MADDFSRVWVDDVDDLDAESMNDLEARMEARVSGNIGVGVELGYYETTTPFTTASTATLGVATGLTVAVNVGTRPIDVIVSGSSWHSTAGFGGVLILREDGTSIGTICAMIPDAGDDVWIPLNGRRRRNPAAGAHTYAIYARNVSAGTLTVEADDPEALSAVGNENGPFSIQVIEV